MKQALVWCRTLIALATALVLVPAIQAAPKGGNQGGGGKKGGSTPLKLEIFDSVVDEHNTRAFYDLGEDRFCLGSPDPHVSPAPDGTHVPAVTGDQETPLATAAYDFPGSPWTPVFNITSTKYEDEGGGTDPYLRIEFREGNKTLAVDTRNTNSPREITFDFNGDCSLDPQCSGVAGDTTVFNGSTTTTGLLNVFLDFPYLDMEVCSSTVCPEAQPAFAKFWFTDPSGQNWRIDWHHLRVLRMSATTWYFIGDACDGTQVAGLSDLGTSNRKRPRTTFNGFYKMPLFVSVECQDPSQCQP